MNSKYSECLGPDRLKNEAQGKVTSDSTDRPEEAAAESHRDTDAQAAETAKTANGSNLETFDALSSVLIAQRAAGSPH